MGLSREDLLKELKDRTPKSGEFWNRAKDLVPGGLMSGARTMKPYPIYIDRAKGGYAWDIDGNRYIDCVMSFGVLLLGHAPGPSLAAVHEQCELGMSLGTPHTKELEFTERFIDCVPCAELGMVCNTGTESTMLAWRLMRAATGRTKIAKFEGCYHGWHDYAQWSVDADPDKWGPAERPHMVAQTSGIPDAVRDTVMVLPFNDSAFDLIEENAGELAGVAIEPIVGGGMLPVDTKFLERLREVTRRHGILLHFDEVITGFRVALGGSQELTGVIPDVATYGKIIGGGTPIGAVACSKALVATAQKSDDGLSLAGTFSGNPLTLAAGTATIRHLQENPGIYDELATRGEGLRNGFNDWAANRGYPFRISGFGSLFQIHNLQVIPSVPRDLAGQDEEVLEDLQLHIRLNDVLHPWFHLAFFSAAHNQKDLDEMLQAFKVSVKGVMEMESP